MRKLLRALVGVIFVLMVAFQQRRATAATGPRPLTADEITVYRAVLQDHAHRFRRCFC